MPLREWRKARTDLITTKDMEVDIIASFHNDCESFEDFKVQHRVKVLENIAALLRRG